MKRVCLITVVILNIITASQAFLEGDNLAEIISTLQTEVAALKNKSCGKHLILSIAKEFETSAVHWKVVIYFFILFLGLPRLH